MVAESIFFDLGSPPEFFHGTIRVDGVFCVTVSGMAFGTTVKETSMKLVNHVGLGIVPIQKLRICGSGYTLLTPVSHMPYSVWADTLLGDAMLFVV